MAEKKSTKPVIYMALKIIGLALLAIGIIVLIVNATKEVPSMSSQGWFEARSSKSMGTFAGVACLMFAVFILSIGFTPEMRKISIKTKKYLIEENKDDMKDIVDSSADIASDAITKTVRAVKTGLEDEVIYCKHCGTAIDADSKFCNKCGGEQ